MFYLANNSFRRNSPIGGIAAKIMRFLLRSKQSCPFFLLNYMNGILYPIAIGEQGECKRKLSGSGKNYKSLKDISTFAE